jgi:2-iminoacetate synthase
MSIINEEEIHALLDNNALRQESRQRESLQKSERGERLDLNDIASLLLVESAEIKEEMHQLASKIKKEIYGNRLVFFAPLYLSNHCVNNCLYCSFRMDNKDLVRATLSQEDIEREVEFLVSQGHKRLLLVAGEHPKEATMEYIEESIKTVYSVNADGQNIRRVNINAAPMSTEDFKQLHTFGIGTYQCFQETYHRETYATVHPSGKKSDYDWRVTVMDRALEAGIDDIGIGVLYGLYDYRFETLAMMQHVFYLEANYNGIGPHTISIPRLEPALNAPLDSNSSPWTVSDEDFKNLVAILRIAVPYTGMILSTRESAETRQTLFDFGISQISAGSKTDPGGYQHGAQAQSEQFQLGDDRPMDEVVRDVVKLGYLPSFCTACYRSGRTGDRFMELAKSGNIGKICAPNALATFDEYLSRYANESTREEAKKLIKEELDVMPDALRKKTLQMIEDIDNGVSDVYL